ncbi:hypothetical protein D3C81_2015780 [compost metagenome]
MPNRAPMMICSAISINALKSRACTSGNGGSAGTMTTVMARAKYSRTLVGTSVVPNTGMVINTAAMRNNGRMKLATQVPI